MLMRKLLVVLGPLMMCLLTCLIFRWLDGLLAAGNFFLYAIKGVALGVCVGLLLPVAGIYTRNTGLTGWLYVAAGLLLITLTCQYLEAVRVVNWPALKAIISINGQVILVESTVMGFLVLTALLGGKRKKPQTR